MQAEKLRKVTTIVIIAKNGGFSSLYAHDLKGILSLQIKHYIYLNDINCTSSIFIVTQQS